MVDRRDFMRQAAGMALAGYASPALLASTRVLPTRRIPGTDERLAVVALGNSNAFRQGDVAVARQLLGTFFEYGGGYVDCGGDSSYFVASLAKSIGHGDAAFLGSYFSPADAGPSRAGAERLRAITGKPMLDLIHTVPDNGVRHWDIMRGWKEERLTRYIGLARHQARYYDMMMKIMATGTLDFLQVNLSPLETEAEDRILPMAQDMGVAVTINRPFLNGRYFSIVKGKSLPAWAIEFDCTSWAQFSLKYILSHPAVTCVLTETARPKHLLDNLGGGIGRLPDPETRIRMRRLLQSYS